VEVPESMFDCRLPIANCQLPIANSKTAVAAGCLWPLSLANQQSTIGKWQ
jgi:hypothetical protein